MAILLPIKLPTAIPGWGGLDKIDFKLVVNSGIVVPSAIVQLAIINCETWSNINYNTPDVNYYNLNKIEVKWLITWFQSIPGYNNNISYLRDGNNYNLTNWWDLFYNWDNAIKEGKTLWE